MKSVRRSLLALLLLIAGLAFPRSVNAGEFASSLVDSLYVSSFGSGLVTGAPDGGGLWLGDSFDPPAHPGYLTVSFVLPLADGPGADLRVYDIASSVNETAAISVSADGISFTPVGNIDAVNNTLDIAGLFAGPFQYVKIQNTSASASMDVDAIEGFNTSAVPEPGSLALMVPVLAAVAVCIRRRLQPKQAA